jgi:Protein of unknown function (DUF1573)
VTPAIRSLGLVLCLASACGTEAIARSPQVTIADEDFDFGRVLKGTVVEHQFVLRNGRASPLVVDELRLTPPLTLVDAPAAVPAGGEGIVRVRLDTSRITGLFEGRIVLSTTGSEHAAIRLTVVGTVYQTVEVAPQPAFFVVTERGQMQEQSIELVNHEPEPIEIKSVSHGQGAFTTRLDTIDAGKRYRLTLMLDGKGSAGRRTDLILVTTSSRLTPVVRIAANTFVRERVYTFPDSVDLGSFPIGAFEADPALLDKIAQTLMVYRKGTRSFDVKLTSDLDVLDIRTEPGPLGDRWQATITLRPKLLKPGPLKGVIRIETNDSEFPMLSVPVSGLVLPPRPSP